MNQTDLRHGSERRNKREEKERRAKKHEGITLGRRSRNSLEVCGISEPVLACQLVGSDREQLAHTCT